MRDQADLRSNGSSAASASSNVRSVLRALDLLELLAAEPGLTLSATADRLKLPRSSAHALLSTMVTRGYVTYAPDDRSYTLGIRTWETGQSFDLYAALRRAAQPAMEALVHELDEICQLAVRDGKFLVYLQKVDCRQPIQLISKVGARLRCHATGLGKALLSRMTEDELDALYADGDLPRFTRHTLTTLPDLKRSLREVRKRGFAEDKEEYVEGLRCVAAPILDSSGRLLAALSVSVPTSRFSPQWLAEATPRLLARTAEIAAAVGSREHVGSR